MANRIPITIKLEADAFDKLERIAEAKNATMRELIEWQLHVALGVDHHRRTIVRNGRPMRRRDVDAWAEAATAGVTNRTIAERWGVSESLVSRYLRERGIHRQRPSRRSENKTQQEVTQ